MNKYKYNLRNSPWVIYIAVVVFIIFSILFWSEQRDRVNRQLYDTCFERLLTETTFDVNDTENRSIFLEECMDKKY